jgi:hypothetical protein
MWYMKDAKQGIKNKSREENKEGPNSNKNKRRLTQDK